MDVANILADHCYHKQISKWKPKETYLGITKRHPSSRILKPDGHKLTVLNKKKIFVGLKRSKREKVNFEKIKPEITKISVPRGEIFVNAVGTKSNNPEHKWNVYEQVSAVVTTVNDHESSSPIRQVTNAHDNRVEFRSIDKSLPAMEAQFVGMGNINQQFDKPNNAEVYSVVVPECVVNIGNSESFISNGQPGILSSLAVYCGNDYQRAETPHFPLECFHGNCYSEMVDLEEQDGFFIGLQLSLLADDTHNHGPYQMRPRSFIEHVYLDDSVQDVLSKLGAPSKVYFKSEDKMKIHSANPDKPPHSGQSDYFFNYFTLGLDVLFDATDHRAKKFIMHTNIPGDYNFDIYVNCVVPEVLTNKSQQLPAMPFQDSVISVARTGMNTYEYDRAVKLASCLLSKNNWRNMNLLKTCNHCQKLESLTGSDSKEIEITPCTKWTEVGNSLTTPTDQPVVLHRGPTVNSQNPFGSTYCHGYQNLIFEVMRNQHIASVTVCTPPINRT